MGNNACCQKPYAEEGNADFIIDESPDEQLD